MIKGQIGGKRRAEAVPNHCNHSGRSSGVRDRWGESAKCRSRWADQLHACVQGPEALLDQDRGLSAGTRHLISRLTGSRPLGWYVGTPGPNTRRLVVDEGGFLYDSDAYNDELPYWNHEFGRPHLIIPHTLDDNDTRLARGLGWGQAGDFFTSLKDNFDALYTLGSETPRMMTVAVHCRLAGKPARAAAFARFVDYVLAQDKVWVCRRLDIARHWAANHPPMEQAST